VSEQPTEAKAPVQPPIPAQADPRDAELARLRQQVDELKAAAEPAEPGDDEVAIKVEEPHSEFHFGNLHLGREFRAVPVRLAAEIHSAAVEAGVRLTQKETEG
jgi:hypothetical protein